MKKTLKILLLIMGCVIAFSINSIVKAASATITASSKSVTVGDSVTVTVNVNAATWNLKVSGEATDSVVGVNSDGENQSTKKIYTIKPTKAGKYTVNLKGDISDGSTDEKSTISDSVTITASEKKEETKTEEKKTEETKKSDNANLKTLGVTPKEYDFSGFSKNKTSYSVTIPSNIDSLNVIAKAEDSKAKVNISGNKNLEVGTNTIKVEVTAEDGKTTKTYNISVTKLATEDEKPGNLLDDENKSTAKLYLKSLSIEGLELTPSFSKNVFSYETTIDMDENDLQSIIVNAEVENSTCTVEITGNENLKEGENIVSVIVKSSITSEQTVYQITVNKVSKTSEVTETKKQGIKRENLIIGLYVLSVIVILAIVIIIKRKKKLLTDIKKI